MAKVTKKEQKEANTECLEKINYIEGLFYVVDSLECYNKELQTELIKEIVNKIGLLILFVNDCYKVNDLFKEERRQLILNEEKYTTSDIFELKKLFRKIKNYYLWGY